MFQSRQDVRTNKMGIFGKGEPSMRTLFALFEDGITPRIVLPQVTRPLRGSLTSG